MNAIPFPGSTDEHMQRRALAQQSAQTKLDRVRREGYAAGYDDGERIGYRAGLRYGVTCAVCWIMVLVACVLLAGWMQGAFPLRSL